MFIPVDAALLRRQEYDCALRSACDQLSANGVRNYIHYGQPRTVELLDEERMLRPVIAHERGGIELVAF